MPSNPPQPIVPKVGKLYKADFPGTWAYPTFLAFDMYDLWNYRPKPDENFLAHGDLLTYLGEEPRPDETPFWFVSGNPLRFFHFRLNRVVFSTRAILTEIQDCP